MKLIAQTVNIYPGDGKDPYARTGQLSFYHLKKAGASGVLLGHSELNEDPQTVNQKLKAAAVMELRNNIVLLGERWEDLGQPWELLTEQQKQGVISLIKKKLSNIVQDVTFDIANSAIFAYEPAWSVKGSGKSDVPLPTPEQIGAITNALRNSLTELFGENARQIPILYGGSMSVERAPDIAKLSTVDGFIIGSAGTTINSVQEIAQALKAQQKAQKPLLALNWKAYELQEPYQVFIDVLRKFEPDIDIYIAPTATDLALIKPML